MRVSHEVKERRTKQRAALILAVAEALSDGGPIEDEMDAAEAAIEAVGEFFRYGTSLATLMRGEDCLPVAGWRR